MKTIFSFLKSSVSSLFWKKFWIFWVKIIHSVQSLIVSIYQFLVLKNRLLIKKIQWGNDKTFQLKDFTFLRLSGRRYYRYFISFLSSYCGLCHKSIFHFICFKICPQRNLPKEIFFQRRILKTVKIFQSDLWLKILINVSEWAEYSWCSS